MTNKLITLLKENKIDLTKAYLVPDSGTAYLENKFNITPKDFLRFAKQDLKQEDERGFINSLTNSKRAIDCQVDEALEKVGIKSNDFNPDIKIFLKHFDLEEDIPLKLKIIHALNLAPSLLISKTRTLRHKLEHIYQKPSMSEVKEALDVADLFIRSVEGKFKSLVDGFYLTDEENYNAENNHIAKNAIYFNFDSNKLCFIIRKKLGTTKEDGEVFLDSNDSAYCGILRLMFSIDDHLEIEESFKATLKHIGHPIPLEKISIIQG